MKVEIEVRVPTELYQVIDFNVETDGIVKLINVIDKLHKIFDVKANKIIINVMIGELVVYRHITKPQSLISITLPNEKIELIKKLMV